LYWKVTMKKKRTPSKSASGPAAVAPAPRAARTRKTPRCVICGNDVAPFSVEELCWICRRLKISAWRDSDNQAAAQE
jgi:hypothetical protein